MMKMLPQEKRIMNIAPVELNSMAGLTPLPGLMKELMMIRLLLSFTQKLTLATLKQKAQLKLI